MSGRRILITGGAGFIGLHLARRLAASASDEVTLVDDFSRGLRDDELNRFAALPNVRLVDADLTTDAGWTAVGRGYDEVYHLAAMIGVRHVVARPYEVLRVNAASTLALLDWLDFDGARKVVFSSTSENYAWTQTFHKLPVPTPEDVPLSIADVSDPRSAYAGSKIFGELAITHGCNARDRAFSIVRYHNVYGPRMGFDHVIPELFMRAVAGQRPLVVYSADHRRAFCYVSDAVDATVAAMRTPAADGVTLNIGNDRTTIRIADLALRILEFAEIDADLLPKPSPSDPVALRCPDLTRARSTLGYEPRVGLDEGLARTLRWYSKHGVQAAVRRERADALGPASSRG
jgi:UDP-glucuronate decarboxylase